MNIKKHIPNTLTSLNLLCGMVGIVFVLDGDISWGAYLIFLAALFDFLDGFVARILQVHSEIGKQLDSLADLVTFGVLPSFILFQMVSENTDSEILPYITLVVGIFSALRLAKFNIDTRQSDKFIGVPTPANALLISTLPFLIDRFETLGEFLSKPEVLIALSIVMSLLLVAELPLIALKFKSYGIKDNLYRYLTLVIGLVCVLAFGLAGIPLLIISYIGLSVVEGLNSKNA
ncbi:CDP-diacylglycerol--serine O-phosphatidyltransferase [Arthrospiribacter ruber]|uniref:CDP-diacylglycerol--serine O-phosphatidyltransferase n=1 Tax=Arthrospiribacter ruber TaxID=2487934 RepID=A0A951M623_9BACT|nr:CDP-diacylglycerol--serine O-phosphatidyltransferase [Arthrospiribacter ruber]MBW3466301.1 CDP-diacylglycerol--serine O-phosphatidyltransferase [Arthrospiribacter ruber]